MSPGSPCCLLKMVNRAALSRVSSSDDCYILVNERLPMIDTCTPYVCRRDVNCRARIGY